MDMDLMKFKSDKIQREGFPIVTLALARYEEQIEFNRD
jgi:hypothetical protein